jgi:non-specific protein-tyrosine kinase
METMLATYTSQSDIIVIDTPPILAVTDAAVLASRADGVVLVTAINETRRDGLRRARAVIDGTGGRLLGTVVNKMTKSQGYYNNYDSKYYGAYTADRPRSRRRGSRRDSSAATGSAKVPTGAA